MTTRQRVRTAATRMAAACALAMLPLSTTLAAHDLADKSSVRIQSDQVSPGWHEGTVQVQASGCALVWTPDAGMPGGKIGLGLMFIQKLQRRQGTTWVDVSVPELITREPRSCQQGNG